MLFSTATTPVASNNDTEEEVLSYASKEGRKKPRVVILGSGWAGFTLARRLEKSLYDVRVVSPANHFLFTPLLPSTAVGTLEFRQLAENVLVLVG